MSKLQGESILASLFHGEPNNIVEVIEIEGFDDLPELKGFELLQNLEFVDEALIVFNVASNFRTRWSFPSVTR